MDQSLPPTKSRAQISSTLGENVYAWEKATEWLLSQSGLHKNSQVLEVACNGEPPPLKLPPNSIVILRY